MYKSIVKTFLKQVFHFDKHPLNTRPVFMDDNARPHRADVVTLLAWRVDNHTSMACQESWFKQIEHIWDIIGRQEKERTPPVQTLNDLEQTVCQEWQRLAQVQIHRLVGSMRRRLAAVIRVNGSCTHYQLFSPDMKFQCLMTLSEYKLCLNDGILDSGINSYQVTFSPPQKWHIFNLTLNFNFWM